VKSGTPDESRLIRYLLGELPEQECRELEQRCLGSEELFEELEAVEAELTDDYVRGVLVGSRRQAFETRLHTPGRADELQFASLVARGGRQERRSWWTGVPAWMHSASASLSARSLPTSLAAATLLLLVAVAWLCLRSGAPPVVTSPLSPRGAPASEAQVGYPGAPQTRTPSSPGSAAPTSSSKREVPVLATFTLTAGATRGEGEGNDITLPRQAQRVRFRLELLPNDYKTYSVFLQRVEGPRLFEADHPKATRSKAGETLAIEVPARLLSPGTFVLTLMGMSANGAPEEAGKYVLRVHAP
jgi:hypothetical protein